MRTSILFTFLCATAALAQTPAAQDASFPGDCAGQWHARNEQDVKLVMQQTGDKIHVQEFKGSDLKSEYTCGLSGKVCKFKDGGRAATVSLWLNGPKLVALETRGDKVTKRRFTLDDKGKTLDEEVLQISPPGETQKIAYSRD